MCQALLSLAMTFARQLLNGGSDLPESEDASSAG